MKTDGEVLDLFLVTFRQTLSGQAKRSREKQKEHPHRIQGNVLPDRRKLFVKILIVLVVFQ